MNNTTRSPNVLKKLLEEKTDFKYGDKLRLGVESYIAQLDPEKQVSAWQQLPYLVQFGPILVKYRKQLPDIRRVNPGIKYGGLTEYDKSAIYDKIPNNSKLKTIDINDENPPTWSKIKTEILPDINFPIMLKPQSGERGSGIYYIHNIDKLTQHRKELEQGSITRSPLSFQQVATYFNEYCLQFYQYYDQAGIHRVIFGGLTRRDTPVVIANGKDNVLDQIHMLKLSSIQKNKIITALQQSQPDLLTSIPTAGEHIQIVRIASIDYGTVYQHIKLDETQQAKAVELIRYLLQDMPPKYLSVGRFDLKADNLESMLDEQRVQIIECNAGGGIPTHVYSQKMSIQQKYNELDHHFDIMENISILNKNKYAQNLEKIKLISRPKLLYVSYKSISKKGLKVFEKDNSQTQELKAIYHEIFHILRLGRISRRKNRLHSLFATIINKT